jgi:hypothetical protein
MTDDPPDWRIAVRGGSHHNPECANRQSRIANRHSPVHQSTIANRPSTNQQSALANRQLHTA